MTYRSLHHRSVAQANKERPPKQDKELAKLANIHGNIAASEILRRRAFATLYSPDEEGVYGKLGAAQAYIRMLEAE